jgi:putative transposase
MRYRRAWTPGRTFFFTVNLADRRSQLLIEQVETLRMAFRQVRSRHPFIIYAVAILPDHLHAIWTLPPGDDDFAGRWALIKAGFSRSLLMTEAISASRRKKGERGIWQRRFWEHRIRDEEDFARHVDYIHWNPVKHGHVQRAIDWPWSSIHRYVRQGDLPTEWGVEVDFSDRGFGER